MYETFFGLRERPFDLTPNPRYLVLTSAHREALSNLEYGIASRKGITLLLGEAGTGKTTLIRTALERQPERVHCVQVQNPALTRTEFVEMLAARFGLSDAARQSKTTLLLELEALLTERRRLGETTVLLVDEAQSLPLELLEEIRLLANIETSDEKLLSVIMAGQPELGVRLDTQELRQMKQRIALRCELRPLTLQESCGYVAGRLRAAGGVGARTFTREAVTLMHERARGIPRSISVIADNALLTGFAAGQRPVGTRLVLEVCRDLAIEGNEETPEAAPLPALMDRQPEPVSAAAEGRMLTLGDGVEGELPVAEPDAPIEPAVLGGAPRRRRFGIF
ncbi:MAG: AAA family ATPase [Acidobacteria bacterium]|nr:AAA family ATPase [Acidobacteriota bacterium]